MKNKTITILLLVLSLLPILITAALYARLPDQIPTHWDFSGNVTYGSKSTIWLVALLPLGIGVLLKVLPRVDPRRANYQKFQGYYDGFALFLVVFLIAIWAVVLSESLVPGRVSVERVIPVGISLLFVGMGNILPKIKNNFFMGIRTPWTLSDPDVWNRTHRLGGKLFFWLGLVMLVCALLLPQQITLYVLMAAVILVVPVPLVMSFIWFKRKTSES